MTKMIRRINSEFTRRFYSYLLILLSFSFYSCSLEPYYVIDDPYLFANEKKSFNGFLLKQSLRLKSPIKKITLANRDEIANFISEYRNRNLSKRPVVSPLIFTEGKELFYQDNIFPVVYNFREEKINDDFIGIVESNRTSAFKLAGENAAGILKEDEYLFLFISVETSQRLEEYNSFLEGFYKIKSKDSIIEVKITSPGMRRPGDIDNYETLIGDRSIGLFAFFSGSFNIELIDRFIIEETKFITEDYKNSLYKNENCVGSIEDDIPGMVKSGLTISSGKSDTRIIFNPAIYNRIKINNY